MTSTLKASKDFDAEKSDEQLAQETETIDVADGPDAESDAGKLRQLLAVLKKVIGVKDLANLRLSLPANLLEPMSNLDWWHYVDRPDLFAAIGDREIDDLTRFIAIIRWILTKELRYVRNRVTKPYNSALGERFRCAWDINPASASEFAVYQNLYNGPADEMAPTPGGSPSITAKSSPMLGSKKSSLPASMSNLSLNDTSSNSINNAHKRKLSTGVASSASSTAESEGPSSAAPAAGDARVAFVTEQVCHHPPISAYWYESSSDESRGAVTATGIDQITAKFNGTSIKIAPGSQNKGIFVKVPEVTTDEYQITHPVGYITGFISRAPYATLSETTYINTLKEGKSGGKAYRAIITYADESWITKPKFLMEGVVYEVAEGGAKEYQRIKDVPENAVVVRLKGTWRGKITMKKGKDKVRTIPAD
ncbi:hypothetical protein EMMF5_003461 [Cystobasidiomycetes sp. EMM_F5]